MQHLLRFGFLDGSRSLFDYGCGRGDDLRLLAEMKVPATGWDPVFRSDPKRQPADIVNLGFVLNVIEDADERRETLKSAFSLARKVLVVSVMLGYQRWTYVTPTPSHACSSVRLLKPYFMLIAFRLTSQSTDTALLISRLKYCSRDRPS